MRITRLLAALAAAVSAARPGAAQQPGRAATPPSPLPVLHAARATGPIRIDGRLDEPDWHRAPVATGFTQSYPNPGARPTDSTAVMILYDNDALYVGVRMFDSDPKQIAAQLARRDATGIYSDWLHVMIGSYHDRRTAFRFSVNPLSVKKDVLEYDDGNEDTNWDAVWDVATRIDSLGWTAEYRIPFSQLRFGGEPSGGRVWDLGIMRDVARRQERDTWAPWTPQSPGFVSSFGYLDDLVGIPTPRRLEVTPYLSGRLTRAPGTPADPFYQSNDARVRGGADVKYGLPNGLTLTATANPDFGQVEVDPAVVNLTAFETFFPEKRPFFLEGSDAFQFGNVRVQSDYNTQYYFYSRRIGRQPQRRLDGSDFTYVDAPDQTTILGAAKLTGHVGHWTAGVLDAVTGEQKARFITPQGTRATTPVEPLTNYFVGRLRHDMNDGNTVFGGMVTATDRSMSDTTLSALLRRGAYMGGLDFEHAWDSRNWMVSGYGSATRVDGTPAAIAATQLSSSRYFQRPDAPYVHFDSTRRSLSGHMGELGLQRNGPVFGSIALKEVSPGFEINDVGFQPRVDYRAISEFVGYQDQTPGKHLRTFSVFQYATLVWNFGGAPTYRGQAIGWNTQFNNLWQINGSMTVNPRVYDARLTRGGPTVKLPMSWEPLITIITDSRWPVTATLSLDHVRDASGTSTYTDALTLDARPTSFIHVNLGPTLSLVRSTDQYVRSVADPLATATYGQRYVFANLKQTTLSLDTRVDWTFTPNFTLQVYAQPFVSAGKYTSLKQLHAPRTYDFDVYGRDAGTSTLANGVYTIDPDGAGPASSFTVGNPDFNIRALHGDAVLRWEFRPGSALYFVWQQERNAFVPIGDFALGRDAGAIFRAQPTNVFLVKVAYWLGR